MKDHSTDVVKRILVVENESELSPFISNMLNSKVVQIDIAKDGETAERLLQERDYTLCVVDLGTLMAKDKQLYQYMNEKYPNLLKGAIFTAEGVVAGDAQVFMAQTGRLFLHKPFAPEWLKEMVNTSLRADRERTGK
jgi:DNA-binding response OmpR family regulator